MDESKIKVEKGDFIYQSGGFDDIFPSLVLYREGDYLMVDEVFSRLRIPSSFNL